ncbi:hypothetical protein F4780DRAFT_783115 [Xylariomycetidae sp. FL0641]|nr:hypothetical protein F4780DRAFT_783115 [Xylariomycetidae sp. FL0641]
MPPNQLNHFATNHGGSSQERRTASPDSDEKGRNGKRPRLNSPPDPLLLPPACRRLVDFYDPFTGGEDFRGRTLDSILEWTDDDLEVSHDYIQTLFPLPEGSLVNGMAPVLDEETTLYFRARPDLKDNMRRALTRILSFYGFDITWEKTDNPSGSDVVNEKEAGGPSQNIIVEPKKSAKAGFKHWLKPLDHNHLRITRILRSLRVLGLKPEAQAFYDALISTNDGYGKVRQSSLQFWKRAMENPLYLAPDGTEVEWLEIYELPDDKRLSPRQKAIEEANKKGEVEDEEEALELSEKSPSKADDKATPDHKEM